MYVTDPETIAHEDEIVWLDDPLKYPYLREITVWTSTRARRPGRLHLPGKVVGYATLERSFKPLPWAHNRFERRVWWFMKTDPYGRGAPIEGVDPSTVRPKEISKHPDHLYT